MKCKRVKAVSKSRTSRALFVWASSPWIRKKGIIASAILSTTVASGATLGGTGKIGGHTSISSGGKLEFNLSTPTASHNPLDMAAGKNFAFAGTQTLTITSSVGAVPGVYTLVTGDNPIGGVAPALANVMLPSGWVATVSISGNSPIPNVSSTGIYVQQGWANGFLPANVGNPAGNQDSDTLTNLQEFAFCMNPTSPMLGRLACVPNGTTSPGLPILENTGTLQSPVFRAVFTRRNDHVMAGLSCQVQF